MTRTDEQIAYGRRLVALVRPTLGERVRVTVDGEGYPIVPGAMGRIAYLGMRDGPDPDGTPYTERLHVYSGGRGTIPRLGAVPGVHRGQMGDREARLWFAADDPEALAAVAKIIRVRVRRASSTGNPAALARAREMRARRAEVVATG